MSEVITDQSTVIMHVTTKLEDGKVADSTRTSDKPAEIIMGAEHLSAQFEQNLLGLKVGDNKEFTLPPEQAYGHSLKENIQLVPREKFTDEELLKEGTVIAFSNPDGSMLPGLVRESDDKEVVVDFNHPLCDQTLTFCVEILKIS